MDYFASVLKLPKWQTKKKCSVLCQADAEGHNSWKNFDTSAPWASTCWTPQTWHLFPGKSPCKLFSDIPGASAVMCSLDFMRNKYLGVDMYIFGSCLHLGINSSNVLLLAWQAFPHWWHPQKNKPPLWETTLSKNTLINDPEKTLWENMLREQFEMLSLREIVFLVLLCFHLFFHVFCSAKIDTPNTFFTMW